MYGWLWRHLPGPWLLRIGELAVLAVGVLALLFYVVFPAADPHLPFNEVTVNAPATSGTPSSAPSPTATTTAQPTPTGVGLVPGN
jgi:hypothetical protein